MFELKPISTGGIPGALQKAERYRLLNDPAAAESICLDILDHDPDNQPALEMLLLARTDQFAETMAAGVARAKEVLGRLTDPFHRAYYAGLLQERRAKALLLSGRPGSSHMAYDAFREAMEHYENAERLARPGNDDARLGWDPRPRPSRPARRSGSSPRAESEPRQRSTVTGRSRASPRSEPYPAHPCRSRITSRAGRRPVRREAGRGGASPPRARPRDGRHRVLRPRRGESGVPPEWRQVLRPRGEERR